MQRCELSDLPVSQCGCRIHKPGQAVDQRPLADGTVASLDGGPGPAAYARYPGRCLTCGDRYEVGELIRVVKTMGGARWGHAACFDA